MLDLGHFCSRIHHFFALGVGFGCARREMTGSTAVKKYLSPESCTVRLAEQMVLAISQDRGGVQRADLPVEAFSSMTSKLECRLEGESQCPALFETCRMADLSRWLPSCLVLSSCRLASTNESTRISPATKKLDAILRARRSANNLTSTPSARLRIPGAMVVPQCFILLAAQGSV